MSVSLLSNTVLPGVAESTREKSSGRDTPEAIREAAGKFEALLVGQLLKAARQSASEGSGEDQTAASLLDMADEHFAELIASRGGLGLARMVTERLTPTSGDARPQERRSRTPA
jgi:Rod binding domain-containing protein